MLLSKQLFFIHTTWNWKEIIWESGKKNKMLCWLNRLKKAAFHLHKKKKKIVIEKYFQRLCDPLTCLI